ncbi:hypothetical protein [Caryophanon latum]|uniref:DUF4276 family protein n=1 Tax=Caryophanon latum TaxID=33977 RepID=A0A1C0YUI6_9BACL|nr:hypothetical protein [Caryophanon latum]OCS90847.1 hypothetical protein A6K76_02005 [Caryophanon latum]
MTLNIGFVTEGPTDVVLLEALLKHILKQPFVTSVLQPIGSADVGYGANGGGWKGVQRWCEEIAVKTGFQNFLTGSNAYDLLIFQIDLDVAREKEVNCYDIEESITQNVTRLQQQICSWLQIDEEEMKCPVILTIPADNLEAWMLAYLNTDEQEIEKIQKPDKLLARKPYKLKKSRIHYMRVVAPMLVENWQLVKDKCSQAKKFEDDVLSCVRQ